MQVFWQECTLEEIMKYFAKDFQLPEPQRAYNIEYFVDVNKGKVVFKVSEC
jgi:hypothetical protein